MRPPHTPPQSPPMLPPPPSLCTLRPRCMRPRLPQLPLFTLLQSPPMRPQPPPPHMVSLRVLQPTSRTHTLVNLIFIYLFICTIHNPCLHGISKCQKDYVKYV